MMLLPRTYYSGYFQCLPSSGLGATARFCAGRRLRRTYCVLLAVQSQLDDWGGSLRFAAWCRLLEAHARATAIFVDESDARGFAHAARGETSRSIRRRNTRPAISKS